MLRLLADEDFSGQIIRGLFRVLPKLDLSRVQNIDLQSTQDPEVLEAAAADGRILLTHDAKTMPEHAYARVRAGKPMPGVFLCPQNLTTGETIDDLVLLADCSDLDEWEHKIVYLPL